MAIEKMRKIAVIALKDSMDAALKGVQELQSVELYDLEKLKDKETEEAGEIFSYLTKTGGGGYRREYEDTVSSIRSAINFLKESAPKANPLESMKKGRDYYTLDEIRQRTESGGWKETAAKAAELETRLGKLKEERKQRLQEEENLAKWVGFDGDPGEFNSYRHTKLFLAQGPTNAKDELLERLGGQNVYVETVYTDTKNCCYFFAMLKEDEADIMQTLYSAGVQPYQYPYKGTPTRQLEEIKKRLGEIDREEEEARGQVTSLCEKIGDLQLAEEHYMNMISTEEAKAELRETKYTFALTGFIEEKKVSELQKTMAYYLKGQDYIFKSSGVEDLEPDQVPIVLTNNKFVGPFETLTEMYSMPKYDELDPTPWFCMFYMVFFGMMVADFGYGLLLFAGGLFALKKLKLDYGLKKSINMFFYLSVPTMVWGIIYGSCFGFSMFENPLLNPNTDVTQIMVLSIIFGFVQIMTGLGLSGYICLKKGDKAGAYTSGFGWLILFTGLVMVILGMMVIPNPALQNAGKWIAIAAAVSMVVVSALASESKVGGAVGGLYNLYGISGYVGDLVSYTRLMALGVAGGSIGVAFNMIIGFMPPVMRFTVGILVFLALHALNIFLAYLGAYVHGARLQYVEFFGKFYSGGGHKLNPLKTYEKYIYIKKNQKIFNENGGL